MVECSLLLHCHLGGLRVVVALFVTRGCMHVMHSRRRIADHCVMAVETCGRDSAAHHCNGDRLRAAGRWRNIVIMSVQNKMGTRNNQPDSMKTTARKHERLTFVVHHCAPRLARALHSPQHPTARDLVHNLKGEDEKVLLSAVSLWRIVLMQQPTEQRIVATECPDMVLPCVLCFLRFFEVNVPEKSRPLVFRTWGHAEKNQECRHVLGGL
jgi:hypothetical protein